MLSWMIAALAIFWVTMLGIRIVPRLQASKPRERDIIIVCHSCKAAERITIEDMEKLYGGPTWEKFKCSDCRGGGSASRTGGKG